MNNKQPAQILSNPVGRPAGSKNKRTLIREALAETFDGGEQGFWLSVATMAKGGDTQAMAMLANRLVPALKPQSEAVVLPEPLSGTSADMARQLMHYASTGAISTSTAQELLSSLADVLKIVEITELEKRLAQLEQLQEMKK
ncbi:MAG TPA: hypothetical protein VFD09_07735 [Thiopseudomonas sp.]|nr:hypothetical protein [Thiopseudomonas sp.]